MKKAIAKKPKEKKMTKKASSVKKATGKIVTKIVNVNIKNKC